MTLSGLDLPDHQQNIVRSILARIVPQHQVLAFGSRVRGNAKPYSDLDLVIMTDHPLSLSTQASLAEAFDESDLPIKVDIVDWATASDAFRDIIRSHSMIVQQGEAID